MNKIIVSAIAILVVVLLAIIITTGFLSPENNTTTQANPTPTLVIGGGGNNNSPFENRTTGPALTQTQKDQAVRQYLRGDSVLIQTQRDAIAALEPSMPVVTDDFELSYSPLLKQFFVEKKTPEADAKINEYFQSRGLPNFYTENPSFFNTVTDSVQTALTKAEEPVLEIYEDEPLTVEELSVLTQSAQKTTTEEETRRKTYEGRLQALGSMFNLMTTFKVAPTALPRPSQALPTGPTPPPIGNIITGDTTNIPCRAGTDAGVRDGYSKGKLYKIRVCNVQGITVNSQVSAQVDGMLSAARAAGLRMSGGGFRDMSGQIAARKRSCGTTQYDIYEKPSSQCRPPVARPGFSNHQMGLAIDINCNGALIGSRSNVCFVWLAANAARYGYKNLPSEPWHWSVDGR